MMRGRAKDTCESPLWCWTAARRKLSDVAGGLYRGIGFFGQNLKIVVISVSPLVSMITSSLAPLAWSNAKASEKWRHQSSGMLRYRTKEPVRMAIYAHSSDSKDESTWEPLRDHLKQVEKLAGAKAGKFGAADYGLRAGWLHDFGKIDPRFQARLRGSKAPFDHAGPGAALARERYGVAIGGILAPIIAGHHTGLMDGTRDGEAAVDITPLDERLQNCMGDLERQKGLWSAAGLTCPPPPSAPPVRLRKEACGDDEKASAAFCLAFFTRMTFSALVDADFIATEEFVTKAPRAVVDITLADLKGRLDDFLAAKSEWARRERPGPLNDARAAILASARASAQTGQGIFTLAVPTGGGKTLVSLAFALDHAVAENLDRVIVVIPFTSVVEQTADVYREALGELEGAVLEHHGAFDDTKIRREGDAPEMRDKLKLAQENWDAPIVVTTAAQFFESLFHNKNSRCRKLHNIARAVVILDEAQTLPLPVLRPIVLALDELARNYRTTIVLSTATQPALLERPDERERSFVGGLRDVRPIIADERPLFQILKRVEIESIGSQDDVALAELISRQDQALFGERSAGAGDLDVADRGGRRYFLPPRAARRGRARPDRASGRTLQSRGPASGVGEPRSGVRNGRGERPSRNAKALVGDQGGLAQAGTRRARRLAARSAGDRGLFQGALLAKGRRRARRDVRPRPLGGAGRDDRSPARRLRA